MSHRWTFSPDNVKDDEQGQGLVEYAFILLLVAVAAVGTLALLGVPINDMYNDAVDAFP